MQLSTLTNQIQELVLKKRGPSAFSILLNPLTNGSKNQCFQILINGSPEFFCKVADATLYPSMFEKEMRSLDVIRSANVVQTPNVICCENDGIIQMMLQEWIEPCSATRDSSELLGEQLAHLHRQHNNVCGFVEDNFIGILPQSNKVSTDWVGFFISERLDGLVNQAFAQNLLEKNDVDHFEKLYSRLPSIFSPAPFSLLHGDLWNGNVLFNSDAKPVLIDPAVYYGHRSMDLAMTSLFGGFGKEFYQAYDYHYPLPENYREEWSICNLYPLLVHLLLFGKSYLPQIRAKIARF